MSTDYSGPSTRMVDNKFISDISGAIVNEKNAP
jgi:hypothetical protein